VNVGEFNARARQAISAWKQSPLAKVWQTGLVLFPNDGFMYPPSGGFPSTADALAFKTGALVFTGRPPAPYPDPQVTWAGGATMKVRALGALSAFGKLLNSGSCPGCMVHSLKVTAAKPTTITVDTSRGQARVPAWAFTIAGVSTPVIQGALAPGSYATVPSGAPASQPPSGIVGVSGVQVLPGGRTLAVWLGRSPCDTRWGVQQYATGSAVVVGGWTYAPNSGAPCAASLEVGPVTVRLNAPLGSRVVLDAAGEEPVGPWITNR